MSDSQVIQTATPAAFQTTGEVRAGTRVLRWCPRADRVPMRIVGDDRVTFLQGMCSNDIKALATGAITYALFLTEHAHVVSDAYVWAAEEALYLDVNRQLWPRTREHLEKFLVADDVEFDDAGPEQAIVDIIGPDAVAAAANAIEVPVPAPWHYARGARAWVAALPRLGIEAAALLAPAAEIGGLRDKLRVARPDLIEIEPRALEVYRVEAGYAEVGRDTGDKTLAMEARLERAISFRKGCYVGQETVERATSRGGIRKRLFGLRIEGRMPAPGAVISADGHQVGELTSVANSPRFGVIGLAVLHNSAWQPGLRVTLSDAGGELAATVSDLPFA